MFYNSTRRLHLLEKREFVNSLGTSGGNKISWYIRYVTVLYNIIAILYFLFSFLPKIRTLLKAKYCEFLDLSDVSKLTVIYTYQLRNPSLHVYRSTTMQEAKPMMVQVLGLTFPHSRKHLKNA